MLEQPSNKSDIFVKLVTSCQQVWNNLLTTLEQAVRTDLVDGLSSDLLQVVRFLRVYVILRKITSAIRDQSENREHKFTLQ